MQFLLLVCLTLELPGFFMPRITMVFYSSVFQPVCRGTLVQWSATTGPRPGAGPCEVCYRSVCVFRINALSLKHFYNVRRNFGTFL